MINDLPYDITHLTIGIQKVAELINKCLVLAGRCSYLGAGLDPFDAVVQCNTRLGALDGNSPKLQ